MMHKKLLIPGPTEVSFEILNEQTKPLMGHRSKAFTALYTDITAKLSRLFELPDAYQPTTTTSSGTLWFDIVGRSIVKKKALCCINGAFSKRFGEIVRSCGKVADFLEAEWGSVVKPDVIAQKLETGEYDTLTMCHNESSTGTRSPVSEVGKLVRKNYPDVVFAVDSVSSMAGDKTLPHEMGVDVLFASTQKCFALPPGLAVALVSDRALERAETVPNRGGYTDILEIFKFEQKHQTPFTPNVSLLYALNKRLDLMLAETYEKIYQRHKDMAALTQTWAKKHFEMFPEKGYESITVSCIKNILGKNVKELNQKLSERGLEISNGYGALAEKTFRIGHMGEWTVPTIKEALDTIDELWNLTN
ncbi:MAG: alanine--glyoxylate aminotransferase family protein [Candidatus Bathyarchaeota archaeon]|nr:alanine--glyoxylate aminotransferase family protein [Candidatus Bathyarchaeota archaeon]